MLGIPFASHTWYVNDFMTRPCWCLLLKLLTGLSSNDRSHSDITTLSKQDLNDEFERLEVALKKILGVKPILFRPPYGNYNDESSRVLSNRGYSSESFATWVPRGQHLLIISLFNR